MNLFIIIFLFVNFFYYSLAVVPIWNIQSAAINLDNSFEDNKLSFGSSSFFGHDASGTLRKELSHWLGKDKQGQYKEYCMVAVYLIKKHMDKLSKKQ